MRSNAIEHGQTRYYTLDEVAAITRTPLPSVRGWVHNGKLRAFRPGKRCLVDARDLEAFIRGEPSRG